MYAQMIEDIINKAFEHEPKHDCILRKNKTLLGVSYFFYNSELLSLSVYEGKSVCYIRVNKDVLLRFVNICLYNIKSGIKDTYVKIYDTDYVLLNNLILYLKDYFDQAAPIEFDCCSRYIECSNNLKCVQPNIEYSIMCSYRKKLNKGIVFYGKNRNVDRKGVLA